VSADTRLGILRATSPSRSSSIWRDERERDDLTLIVVADVVTPGCRTSRPAHAARQAQVEHVGRRGRSDVVEVTVPM